MDATAYWTDDKTIAAFPTLCVLAERYLSAPGTSVESERLFSTASETLTPLCQSMSAETLEKVLFLHHNIKIMNID